MIDSAASFFRALKTSGSTFAAEDDAAIKVLDEQFRDHQEACAHLAWPQRLRYMFWNGALLGARIAARGWANRLLEAAREEARKTTEASNN